MRKPVADSYMNLINAFPLRRIRSVTEHAKAKTIVLRLSAQQADRGAMEYLDVLVDLIADYEERLQLAGEEESISTAELVRHRTEERGTSVNALAASTGIPQSNLSEILSGQRDWSKAAIRALSAFLNIRAELFLA